MKYFEDDMYFDDDEFLSTSFEGFIPYDTYITGRFIPEPLKLTSADDCLASPDDWLDTYLFIQGIK